MAHSLEVSICAQPRGVLSSLPAFQFTGKAERNLMAEGHGRKGGSPHSSQEAGREREGEETPSALQSHLLPPTRFHLLACRQNTVYVINLKKKKKEKETPIPVPLDPWPLQGPQ